MKISHNIAERTLSRLRVIYVTLLLRDRHWLPVKQRVEYKLCMMVHRCLYGDAPSYLADLIMQGRRKQFDIGPTNIFLSLSSSPFPPLPHPLHFPSFPIPSCQGYVPLTLDVMRVAFKVPLAFHTPL